MRSSSPISYWWPNSPLWFLLFLLCAAFCFCPNASFVWLSRYPLIRLCCSYIFFWLSWVRPADWLSLSYLFLSLWPYPIAQSGCLLILFGYFPFLAPRPFNTWNTFYDHIPLNFRLLTLPFTLHLFDVGYGCLHTSCCKQFLRHLSFCNYWCVVSSLCESTAEPAIRGTLASPAHPACWLKEKKWGQDQILLLGNFARRSKRRHIAQMDALHLRKNLH